MLTDLPRLQLNARRPQKSVRSIRLKRGLHVVPMGIDPMGEADRVFQPLLAKEQLDLLQFFIARPHHHKTDSRILLAKLPHHIRKKLVLSNNPFVFINFNQAEIVEFFYYVFSITSTDMPSFCGDPTFLLLTPKVRHLFSMI